MKIKPWLASLIVLFATACGAVGTTPVGGPLTVSQLKFRVIDAVGAPVYCDPDFYPVAREGGEEANALAQYPQIRADAELYPAILAHENLPSGELTDAQKLTVYRAYKTLRVVILTPTNAGYSFQLRVPSRSGSASFLMTTGVVTVDGVVTVTSQTPTGPPVCPICLASTTLIATPDGAVAVTSLRPGMLVWTRSADGGRTAAPILEIGSTPVPAGHLMVHLRLADGRELWASPGHRTADGRPLGALAIGDRLDGSTLALWELVPYGGERTYDLLPAGPTGTYWANGILLASTLQRTAAPGL